MSDVVGIGTDIVECVRIGKMIAKHGELFLTRVFTDRELRYCQRSKAATEHFAGRWAAKEAVLKCLGTTPGKADHPAGDSADPLAHLRHPQQDQALDDQRCC